MNKLIQTTMKTEHWLTLNKSLKESEDSMSTLMAKIQKNQNQQNKAIINSPGPSLIRHPPCPPLILLKSEVHDAQKHKHNSFIPDPTKNSHPKLPGLCHALTSLSIIQRSSAHSCLNIVSSCVSVAVLTLTLSSTGASGVVLSQMNHMNPRNQEGPHTLSPGSAPLGSRLVSHWNLLRIVLKSTPAPTPQPASCTQLDEGDIILGFKHACMCMYPFNVSLSDYTVQPRLRTTLLQKLLQFRSHSLF